MLKLGNHDESLTFLHPRTMAEQVNLMWYNVQQPKLKTSFTLQTVDISQTRTHEGSSLCLHRLQLFADSFRDHQVKCVSHTPAMPLIMHLDLLKL